MKKLTGLLMIGGVVLSLSGCGVTAVTYEPAVYRSTYVYSTGYYPADYYVGYGLGYWGSPNYYNTYYYLGY